MLGGSAEAEDLLISLPELYGTSGMWTDFVDCDGLLLVVLECSGGQQGIVSLDEVG